MRRLFAKQFLLSFVLIAFFFCSFGQDARDHLAKGDRAFDKKDYEGALKSYLDALAVDAGDALVNFKTGMCYFNIGDNGDAVVYLEKAYDLNPKVDPFIEYHLGMAYQGDYKFRKAGEHFTIFRKQNKKLAAVTTQKLKECKIGDSLMNMPARAEVHPMGPEINTPFAEHSPLVTPDGNTLIFTSTRADEGYKLKSSTNYEDVYVSHRAAGQWSGPEKIGAVVNSRYNEAAVSLSTDGKTLFLYYEEGHGDIYTSTLDNGAWTKPVPLNQFINHPLYRETTACMSADGKSLFFASNRPGGKGGLDIYVSKRGAKGDWGRPTNLGSSINTRKDEDSPFPDRDGVTLYFSSDGHPGLGSSDIFKSALRGGKWAPPENLGYPVNSTGYDGFFTLSADGRTGYYSAHHGADRSNTDIFVVTFLPTPVKDKGPVFASIKDDGVRSSPGEKATVALLRGRVTDLTSGTALKATVTLVDNATNQVVSKVDVGPDGRFQMQIPSEGNYGVTAERDGYLFHSINLNLQGSSAYREIESDIAMLRPKVGSKVVLKNIFFDVNESEPKAESITELENIRNLLARNQAWRVQINGHTDSAGNPESNLILSLKRAQSVVRYLVEHGIAASRLEAKGFGAEKPLVSNDDEEEGRQINRRTEIEIIP
jgi:outer membrane protein OmpA-like peptidoglycan-associated protein